MLRLSWFGKEGGRLTQQTPYPKKHVRKNVKNQMKGCATRQHKPMKNYSANNRAVQFPIVEEGRGEG